MNLTEDREMAVLYTQRISEHPYAYTMEVDKFLINTDAPKKLGGNDFAPDPHQYLEAALAGCTALTVEMYAKRKNMDLASVNVKISIVEEGEKNRILREINFVGNLSEEERASLVSIANRCPIHKFLNRGAEIDTKEF